jgi:uncharacterized protein
MAMTVTHPYRRFAFQSFEPESVLTDDERRGLPARHHQLWAAVTAVEVVLACTALVLDLLVPSLLLIGLALLSLMIRRCGFGSLGFHRLRHPVDLVMKMFGFAVVWSLFQLAVTMPIASHLSGHKTDLSDFADLQGNVGMLLGLLALSWTVAALGEELAFRGYLQTRIRDLFGSTKAGLILAVLISSVLFGRIHSEQGAIGVLIISLDALAFSVVRYRFKTVWASVLTHGFNNTIGFITFFLVGPVYGFW